jgi:hypothetical protein
MVLYTDGPFTDMTFTLAVLNTYPSLSIAFSVGSRYIELLSAFLRDILWFFVPEYFGAQIFMNIKSNLVQ